MERLRMQSLTAYVPTLARLLDMTPLALYERQRALVRMGMLAKGRQGAGIAPTAETIARLLVASLATGSLSEVEERSAAVAGLMPRGAGRCPLTGMLTFLDAVASILTSKSRSRGTEITVSRTADHAVIVHKGKRYEYAGLHTDEPSVRVSATLSAAAVARIADDLIAFLNQRFDEQDRQMARERAR
jgi:hypothetical protein